MGINMKRIIFRVCFCFLINSFGFSQEDLESLLGPISNTYIINNTFKSTRVINAQSIEIFEPNQLDLRISHRFGRLNSGFYDLFGLDQATIRIGLEYGLLQNMMIGIGRSSYNKTYDGFFKYVLINQQKGDKHIPFSMAFFSNLAINSLKQNQNNYPFSARFSYCNQLIIASKINTNFSFQFMPTWVHWNMVETSLEKNDILSMGFAFRYLITKSLSINSEYFFSFIDELSSISYNNSFSFGVDIETGGHVFQLHITNSLPMHESGFITRTRGAWSEGDIHFGFNISREFNL